jgi:hypothetical protein
MVDVARVWNVEIEMEMEMVLVWLVQRFLGPDLEIAKPRAASREPKPVN